MVYAKGSFDRTNSMEDDTYHEDDSNDRTNASDHKTPFFVGLGIGFFAFLFGAIWTRKSLLIPIGKGLCFHVHHYLLLIPIAALVALFVPYTAWTMFFLGICLGGSATNALYPDWATFIKPYPKKNLCSVPLRGTGIGNYLERFCS